MRSLLILTATIGLLHIVSAAGQAPPKPSATAAPHRTRETLQFGHGTGLVEMDVDYKSGRVTAARMLASTGDPRLDTTALDGFRKFRFKPHTRSPVKTPITFVQNGRGH